MGVCVGLLPTKGLSFPLLSYGGSSLVASLVVVGLLLNVSQHSN
jgi:cell division protein FtsW